MTSATPGDLGPSVSQTPFVPDAVPPDPPSMTVAWVNALRSEQMTLYRQALGLPSQPDVKAAVLDDLQEYWGFDVKDWVNQRIFSDDEQKQASVVDDPTVSTVAGARISSPESRAFSLLWRSYLQATGGVYPTPVIVSHAMRPPSSAHHCLDLGSGVGDMAQLLLALGYPVDFADVSPQFLEFARWRLARRGQDARFINLKEEPLPVDRYDSIIAKDLLVHVSRPDRIVARLCSGIRPHGVVIANVHPEPPALNTVAISRIHDSLVHQAFIEAGFEMIGSIDHFLYVYRRWV